ncbi:MAG TPA: lipoyl(octanoyl) transferase LipB [Gemmatimonadaceae bacterium]|jgi:lipoyl(octanoyl) transferase|nr:lipoyl(octanoyl) transferase LipB [Gemmatimonadaceae bacterium]
MQVKVVHLGTIPYLEALALQRAAASARLAGTIPDVLLLCEHPPVVTLGRSTKTANLTTTPAALAARGIEVHEVERGGDVTFHGPGQLVGYPILDLSGYRKDLHWYLRQLENVLITTLAHFDIAAEQRPGLTGVWTTGRKIASIGVHARGWVTWHGFALNVTTDLTYFDLMIPCGIADVEMTSIARERPNAAVETAPAAVTAAFAEHFGAELMSSTPDFLYTLQV